MPDITISYKGSSIATMSASGTKTLLTEGKYCEDDIEIVYVQPSGGGSSVLGITQDANGYLVLDEEAIEVAQWTEETVSDTGAVTQALSPFVYYHFTGALTSLTVTLATPESGQMAHYHFDFDCGSTAPTVTIPNTVTMPGGQTFAASTHYEIDILDNFGAVLSWANS